MDGDHLSLVRKLQESGQYGGAVSLLNSIEGTKDWYPQYLLERAICLININRENEALSDLTRYLLINPDNARAMHKRGLVHSHLGNGKEALKDLEDAVKMSPMDVEFLLDLADEYKIKGDCDLLIATLNKIISIDSDSRLVRTWRGEFYISASNPEAALIDFSYLSENEPENADHHFCKGRCLAMMNKYSEALEAIDEALEIDPSSSFFYDAKIKIETLMREV